MPMLAIEFSSSMSTSVNEKDRIVAGELSSKCCRLNVQGMLTTPDCALHRASTCAGDFPSRSAMLMTCDDLRGGMDSGKPSICTIPIRTFSHHYESSEWRTSAYNSIAECDRERILLVVLPTPRHRGVGAPPPSSVLESTKSNLGRTVPASFMLTSNGSRLRKKTENCTSTAAGCQCFGVTPTWRCGRVGRAACTPFGSAWAG